ncbi:ATP-binding protein [Hydrocarboniphaga effusa]|uniref:ATP-binding protein n=1 Tax=Hydrocarboniphaga effusa TaxID=243629 RepID=UPI0035AD9BD5
MTESLRRYRRFRRYLGRPTSLRQHLLRWLLPAYVLVGVLITALSWLNAADMVHSFMDGQMESFARLNEGADHASSLKAVDEKESGYSMLLWSPDGRLLDASEPGLPLFADLPTGHATVKHGKDQWLVYTLRSDSGVLQCLQRMSFRRHVIFEFSNKTLIYPLLLIPLSSYLIWLVIRASLRPLERVSEAAAAQDERNLSALPLTGVPDEIRPLVQSINSLLARLRQSFSAQQRFVHDAAHELRTPMAALKLQLQNLRAEIPEAGQARIDAMESGVQRAHRLVEQMLRLARGDAKTRRVSQPVSLENLLRESIAALMPLADARRIDLGCEIERDVVVQGQADELRSVIDNLIDNALRYSPQNGTVDLRLSRDKDGAACIEILDEGPGISGEHLPRVFDRFFRVLGTGVEGSGLGLAIAQGAALRQGAQIELHNRPGRGLVARLRFDPQAV